MWSVPFGPSQQSSGLLPVTGRVWPLAAALAPSITDLISATSQLHQKRTVRTEIARTGYAFGVSVKTFLVFPLETTSCAGKRKAEKLRSWRRGLGMEGERAAKGREAGVGAMVLTVHHASVPPRSVEKWGQMVQEKAEKLQPQPTFPA